MHKRIPVIICLVVLFSALLSADTLKTVNLSVLFSTIPGTPRVIRNTTSDNWLVVWRQQGAPTKIFGRHVDSNGGLKARKALVSGVSSSAQNFDIAFNSSNNTYLLAYEDSQGLKTQLYNAALAKQGSANVIASAVNGVLPKVAFDSANSRFLIFWLGPDSGTARKKLMSRLLDATGRPVDDAEDLKEAAAGKSYATLEVTRNGFNGNLLAMILELNTGSAVGSVLGFNIRSNGDLIRPLPLKFQGATANLITAGSSDFASSNGTGFGIWTDRTAIKYRKLSATGTFTSPTKSIANAADASSTKPSITFDSQNNQFVGTWAMGKLIRGVGINSSSGAISVNPFTIVTGSATVASSANVRSSSDNGRTFVVWEDITAGPRLQIRGALFTTGNGGGGGGGNTLRVNIVDNQFSPRQINVRVGDSVEWTNTGNNNHTVTSGDPSNPGQMFNSGNLFNGSVFRFTFNSAGTFEYFCQVHGQVMSGTVVVQ